MVPLARRGQGDHRELATPLQPGAPTLEPGLADANEFVAQGARSAPRQAMGRDAAVCGASAPRPIAQPSRAGQMQQAREAFSS
jgi:hypothetical protein